MEQLEGKLELLDSQLGHSVGEYVAAVVAGTVSLEDGLKMIAARGRLIEKKCKVNEGSMASIFASEEAVKKVLSKTDIGGELACISAINGPAQTVISGHKKAVDTICAACKAELGVDSRVLAIPHAMHSDLTAVIVPELKKEIAEKRILQIGRASCRERV